VTIKKYRQSVVFPVPHLVPLKKELTEIEKLKEELIIYLVCLTKTIKNSRFQEVIKYF